MPQLSLILSRKKYIQLDKFQPLKSSHRSFTIWRWDPNGIVTQSRYDRTPSKQSGCWKPWLVFTQNHWHQFPTNDSYLNEKTRSWVGTEMRPAHKFWETEEDFLNWLGEDEKKKLFVDLL